MPPRERLEGPNLSPSGAYQTPGHTGARVFNAFADAAPALAQGANAFAEAGIADLDQNAKEWAAKATSRADLDAQDMLRRHAESAGDGAPEFKNGVMEDWRKYQGEVIKKAPDERTRRLMVDHFGSVSKQLEGKAQEYELGEQARWRDKTVNDGVDADARLMSTQSAEEIDGLVEKSLGKWTSYYKSISMTPGDRQQKLDAVREKITNAANMRKIQLDPTAYLNSNAAGRNPERLQADPSAPRGIRNNNPGNLRTKEFAGTVGVDDQGYGKFDSPEAGLRAMALNLMNQGKKHGLNTVEGIISKYAPPNENNTAAYIQTVADKMDVKPGDRINLQDPETLQLMMTAMIRHENGVQPYSAAQIAVGIDAAMTGKQAKAMNGTTPDQGGRVQTGSTAYSLGTWEQQQRWISLAEAEQRTIKAEQSRRATEAGAMISGAKERMEKGFLLPEDESATITQAVVASGDAKAAKAWTDLRETQFLVQKLQQLSPAQLATVINSELLPMAHRDGATPREGLQLDVAEKLLNNMTTKVKADPLSWAAMTGMDVPALDFNNPQSLVKRVATAEAVATKYGIPVERAIFSQSEKEQFISSMESMQDVDKLRLGKMMQANFGKYFTRAVGQLAEKDPIFSHAAFLSGLSSRNDALALDILRGQRVIKENPKARPSFEEKQVSLGELGNAFEYMPKAAAGIVEAADALYAKRVGFVEAFDRSKYDKALTDVMGKTGAGGGIGTLNDQQYLLPQEFSEDDFERGLQSLTADDLAAMSVGGGPPIYGKGKVWSGRDIYEDAQVRSIAYGQYALFDSEGRPLTNPNGPEGQFIMIIDPVKFGAVVRTANERRAAEQKLQGKQWGVQ